MHFSIVARDRMFVRKLRAALHLEALRLRLMRGTKSRLRYTARDQAGFLLYAFDPAAMDDPGFADAQVAAIQADSAPVKLFLQLASREIHGERNAEIGRKNRIIETMARRCGANLVMMTDLMHSGMARRLRKSGEPNLYGYASIAHVALLTMRTRALRVQVQSQSERRDDVKPDAKLPDAATVMGALAWHEPFLPASLEDTFSAAALEEFLAGRVYFPAWQAWGKIPLGDPIDWAMAGANWSWQSYFTGLEFLRPALTFWFDWANGKIVDDEVRKTLGSSDPDTLLVRASRIIGDFVRHNPASRPANERAFLQGTICRRVKVLLTYLICCRKAADKGLAIDSEEIALAFRSLTESFELLRNEEVYPKAGNHGVRQDILFIVAGLLLPSLPYGQELLRAGLDRLQRFQIDKALSPDGVWLENSFGYHCLIMNVFVMLAADLRTMHGPAVVHDALRRMWPFTEALIKCNGQGPLIGDTAPRVHFNTMVDVRRELDLADGKPGEPIRIATFERASGTYYFPDAGYFASHTNSKMAASNSSVVFFANLSTPKHKQSDDLSVLLTVGAKDLLIDGGTYNKEISDSVRNAARFDPAAHNTFRIGGAGYTLRTAGGRKPAGLNGTWSGPGWAAARGFNNAYQNGRVVRTAIHLKQRHTVIVLDQLAGKGATLFEQFWHLSPQLVQQQAQEDGALVFAHGQKGFLSAAFHDDGADCEISHGSADNPIAWIMVRNDLAVPTPYIRRAKTLETGVMASLFQWNTTPVPLRIAARRAANGAFAVKAQGARFVCEFVVTMDEVRCIAFDTAPAL